MTAQAIRICRVPDAEAAQTRRRNRRYVLLNTLGEALSILGIGFCFVVCSVLLLCVI